MRLYLHVDINGVNKATLSAFKTLAPKGGLIHTTCTILDNGMKTHVDFINEVNRQDILGFCAELIKIHFISRWTGQKLDNVFCDLLRPVWLRIERRNCILQLLYDIFL